MQNTPKPKKIKIVLLGNRAVGKSSLIRRFVLNDFPLQLQPTIGVDYMSKTISINSIDYRLELWDTAGQQKYRSLVKGYLKGAHGCIYVYDCKNINSYMGLVQWINLFQTANANQHASIIAGNKIDLMEQADWEIIQKAKKLFKADEKKIALFQEIFCSAKSQENVYQIFMKLALKIIQQQFNEREKGTSLFSRKTDGISSFKCCQH